jgi:two-component system sensor histidine kinase/response regulator
MVRVRRFPFLAFHGGETPVSRDPGPRRITAEHVAARALVESATLAEAMPRILRAICEAFDWDHGASWTVDIEAGVLRFGELWHPPGVEFPEFERASRGATFLPGVGLPGRVWETGQPTWIPDVVVDPNFPRAPIAIREGQHAALGFPILHEGAVHGVLEFFSREIREPDDDLLAMLGTVGSQIGLFLERRRAEEELDRFFRLSSDLLCIATVEGQFKRINPAWHAVLGWDDEELLSRHYLHFVHPDDREASAREASKLSKGERVVSYENRYRCKNGSYRWLLWMATPSPDRRWTYAAAHDITQRKESEAALARHARELEETRRSLEDQASRQTQLMHELVVARKRAEHAAAAKGEFLANMSHEIRTPLNAILGMTELTVRTRLTAEQREYLNAVKSASQALLDIVNDVLDFSKIEARRLDLDRVLFDLRESVGDTARLLAFRAAEKGLELAFSIAPDVPESVIGDPGRLRQVLVNLLGNGVKFTEQGEIVLSVENEGSTRPGQVRLRFSVRDTGVGVPEDRREEIFEAFVQADSSATRRFGGTGLGLAIAARLVEMMDGEIWLEGNEAGGSTFHFTANFTTPRAGAAPAPPGRPAQAAALEDLKVLVVDDNATNRRILEEMLAGWRMRPVALARPAEALVVLADPARVFDLVLTDYQMPEMDGIDLARRIRRLPNHARTPILMLTSVGRPEEVEKSREAGIDACLTKPVKHSDLLEAIASCCGAGGGDARPPRVDGAAKTAARPLRVLVAEDNVVNRKLVVTLLSQRGHQVATAQNGREAVDAVARAGRGGFDVVIMDGQMPEMDGFEAARAIRVWEKTIGGHLPILALTAHAMKGDRERCLAAGMDEYLSKPIELDALVQAVEGAAPPSAGPDAPPVADPASSFDEEQALARTGGDRALLKEIIVLFRADATKTMRRIEGALRKHDAERLREAAHALRGSAATIGATGVREWARRLEQRAAAGDTDAGPALVATLRAELARLDQAFEARGWLGRRARARPG